MPLMPTRFGVNFGDVFPLGAFVLGVEPSMAFQEEGRASKAGSAEQQPAA